MERWEQDLKMADLDNRSKRASGLGALRPYLISPVFPDGTISQGDRQHISWMYGGILATEASVPAWPTVMRVGFKSRVNKKNTKPILGR